MKYLCSLLILLSTSLVQAQSQVRPAEYICHMAWTNKDHPGYFEYFVRWNNYIHFPVKNARVEQIQPGVFQSQGVLATWTWDLNRLQVYAPDLIGQCWQK